MKGFFLSLWQLPFTVTVSSATFHIGAVMMSEESQALCKPMCPITWTVFTGELGL